MVLASAILLAAAVSGPDASWDLRNYHLYNGYAWLHGRTDIDLDPAQRQTFYCPLLDIANVLLLQAFNHAPWLLSAMLAIPQAIAGVLLLALASRLLPRCQAWAATIIGLTGAAGLSTLGTTMSEMAPAACVLGALLLLIHGDETEPSGQACCAAGLLGGIAVGLKLTAAPYALGLAVMLSVFIGGRYPAQRLLLFVAGGLVGAAITGGFWWRSLWQSFANPVFPYFNNVFHSPWSPLIPMADPQFIPHSVLEELFYPLFWAVTPQTPASEMPIRDPRIALGWIAALVIVIRAIGQRHRDRHAFMLPVFWAFSYVAWELCFLIFRYLAALELLSGTLILSALRPVLARLADEWQRACAAALALLLFTVTVHPDWGRAVPGGAAVEVTLPSIPTDSLVVLLDPSPMSYVAAFAPLGVRFVGANNNLVRPGERSLLARQVEAAIRAHAGPLWGIEMPAENRGVADTTLRAYGLRRAGGCAPVRSNLDRDGILACPLVRTGPGTLGPLRN